MRVRVKICGITNVADALLAVEAGADAIGLNFYQGSARYIEAKTAADIRVELPPFVEPIALFVNESMKHIEETANNIGIHTAQIHADSHKPFDIRGMHWMNWIPAFSVQEQEDLAAISSFLDRWRDWSPLAYQFSNAPLPGPSDGVMPAAVLVDAHVPGMYGGTGQVAPWHLLANYKEAVPLILAGGLTPDNVAEAIRIVRPYAVDVASGVESAPGKKDADKLRRFIEAVRDASV